MSHRILLTAVVAVSLVACERAVDVTSPTRAARAASFTKAGTTKTNDKIDINQTFDNTCNGDVITVTGTAHETITISDSRLLVHVNFDDLTGVGVPSGAQYHLNAGAHEHDFTLNTTNDQDEVINEELIGQGDSNNNLDIHITETIHSDGTVTFKRMTMDCR